MPDSNPSQTLEITNMRNAPMEILVEIAPDRYLLQPGERMVIEADLQGAPFYVLAYDHGLQIYPGNDCFPPVKIDGVQVEPDWETKLEGSTVS